MRANLVIAWCLMAGCGVVANLTRPEGDGGWSPAAREGEIARRATAAALDAAAGEEGTRGPLDLAAALRLAAQGNRRVAIARQGVEAAGERVAQQRAALLPQASGTGRYTWYSDPLVNQVAIPGIPGGVQPAISVRDAEVGTVGAALTVPIDLTGELRHALAAAHAGYRGERARAWAATLEQQVAVIRAYFQLLEAERLREVTEQTILTDRQQLTDAQNRYDVGQLTRNELLVVQVALRNAEQDLVRRRLAIDRARWALNDGIGLPVDAPTVVTDVLAAPELPDESAALRQACRDNPLLAALLEEQQRLEETATALARGRLPRFGAGGALDYSSSGLLQPQRIESGWVGFTWDLGTDGRREAQIAEARIAAERNRLVVEQELRALEAAVRATRRAVAERLSALATAEVAVTQAEENLRIRREQFQVGRATSEDVLDAERLLAVQRAMRAAALYQAHVHHAELKQLMGLPLDGQSSDSR